MPEGINENYLPSNEAREKLTEAQKEIKGVWEAIHFVDKVSKGKKARLGEDVIRRIQERVMGHYHPEVRGQYRDFNLDVLGAGFIPTHHKKVRQDMLVFGRDLEKRTSSMDKSFNSTEEVIKTAAWAHYSLVRIHPFAEGNGRTARLLVDLITKKGGMYYITNWGDRDIYLATLKRVDETGDIGHFEKFLAKKFADRYEEVSNKIIKGRTANQEKVSPVIADLLNRKQRLLRMSK